MVTGETQGRKAQGQGQSGWGRAERGGGGAGRRGRAGGRMVGKWELGTPDRPRRSKAATGIQSRRPGWSEAARAASPRPDTRPPPLSPWEPTDGGDPPATSLRRGEETVTFRGAVGAAAPRAGRASSRPPATGPR